MGCLLLCTQSLFLVYLWKRLCNLLSLFAFFLQKLHKSVMGRRAWVVNCDIRRLIGFLLFRQNDLPFRVWFFSLLINTEITFNFLHFDSNKNSHHKFCDGNVFYTLFCFPAAVLIPLSTSAGAWAVPADGNIAFNICTGVHIPELFKQLIPNVLIGHTS